MCDLDWMLPETKSSAVEDLAEITFQKCSFGMIEDRERTESCPPGDTSMLRIPWYHCIIHF